MGMLMLAVSVCIAQPATFVTRSNDTLMVGAKTFYFAGANGYYLMEQAARGDSATVKNFFETANAQHMTVVRTWGFFDSSDSTNLAVIQFRPGRFNERALKALDYVIFQARAHNVRLLIPFVNSWDDYGGMNQYVRWRSMMPVSSGDHGRSQLYTQQDLQQSIHGTAGRSYRYAITTELAHDDFYSDEIIRGWYRNYLSVILSRINTYSGIRYADEPAILGWELANEPRSSDRSGNLILSWVKEMSLFIKSIDANHLVGTGEEGFDVSLAGYSMNAYNGQYWLFDGTGGSSFFSNTSLSSIDLAGCHLYPASWGFPLNSGNDWIRDHTRLARSVKKPFIVGEFGVREDRAATYDSWMTTALYDGSAGTIVWQLLAGPRTDAEGYGFRCPDEAALCEKLKIAAFLWEQKSASGSLPAPQSFSLLQNYPNPFNGATTISYNLPFDAHVNLSVYTIAGQRVGTLVDAIQGAGERKELWEGRSWASGVYFYRLTVTGLATSPRSRYIETRKLLLLR